jgi:succinate-acetate transporter protein
MSQSNLHSAEDLKAPEAAAHNTPNFQGGNAVSRFITPGGHPMDTSQPAFPVFHRKFANPAPLGLMAFGGTTILLSLYNLSARDIHTPNVLVGVAMFYGGLCQIVCGVLEWACGNSFGTCAFTGYGAFWMSWAAIQIPWFGVKAAYTDKAELMNAIGLYLVMWGIVTTFLTICLFRSSVALVFVFADIAVTFFILAAADMTGNGTLTKVGGGFGFVGGMGAMYVAVAGLLTNDTSFFTIPIGNLAPKN